MEIAIVFGLLIVGVVLFANEVISVDVTTLLLLIGLVLTRVLTPSEALAGFSNEIIVILASIFVLSGAVRQSGLIDGAGLWLQRIAGTRPTFLVVTVMATAGIISAFMNNTTTTAVLLPAVLQLAKNTRISPTKLLMPLAFGSILGGTCTLIGTSTNVAVSGYISRAGFKPVGLFELLPLGLVILAVGILYMALFGIRLLPDYEEESLTEDYSMREYLSEIAVVPNSPLVGQSIVQSALSRLGFQVLEIIRGPEKFLPDTRTRLKAGDILLVEGKVHDLMKVKDVAGIEIRPELKVDDPALRGDNIKIGEAMIPPQSDLIGRTLKEVNFRQRFGLTALAIYRHGQSLRDKIGRIRLRVGDLLLIQGPAERFPVFMRNPDVWILGEFSSSMFQKRSGISLLALYGAAVVAGGAGWLPLSIAFLSAAVLAILLGCLTVDEAYEFIDWKLIILIGGMTAFGTAMEKSGAAAFLASSIVDLLQPFGTTTILAGFFFLTLALTQPMSNAAAALVVLPVALATAQRIGANERSFAIAIMLAASVSLVAPLEPACLLVYGPGRYRFMDFVKTGIGLTAILALLILLLAPMFWPL